MCTSLPTRIVQNTVHQHHFLSIYISNMASLTPTADRLAARDANNEEGSETKSNSVDISKAESSKGQSNKQEKKYTVTEWRTEAESGQLLNTSFESGVLPKQFDSLEEATQYADYQQSFKEGDEFWAIAQRVDYGGKYVLVEINYSYHCNNVDCNHCVDAKENGDESSVCCPDPPLEGNIVYEAYYKTADFFDQITRKYRELEAILDEHSLKHSLKGGARWTLTLEKRVVVE